MNKSVAKGKLKGKIHVPPSKSDGQRALLCAALAKGRSVLHNLGPSADEQAMLHAIQSLGAQVDVQGNTLRITGIESFPKKIELNCGESGLGFRLLAGICAVHSGEFILCGEGSILKRDQSFFTTHFPMWGAQCKLNENRLPLQITAPIQAGKLSADGSSSSQYISGLLMALPLLTSESTLCVQQLTSRPYVDMTLDTLKAFGIRIEEGSKDCFAVHAPQKYQATNYTVDGDWSAASYWLAAAALGHELTIDGLRKESLQADKRMLYAIESAGCQVEHIDQQITVKPGNLRAFEFDATHCPDLFPALVTLAAFCSGITTLRGVSRLANKESDRGLALQSEFQKMGLRIEIKGDEMSIHGGAKLKSARVSSHNDHRIAMCLAIAALQIDGGLEIDGAEAVAKSYPAFWDDLNALHSSAH